MTNNPLAEIYAKRESEFRNSLQSVNKKINRISNFRILIALLVILVTYLGFSNTAFFWGIPFLIVFFLLLAESHGKAFDAKVHLENLARINFNEMALLKGNFSTQYSGAEFLDPLHPYSHDLDLFGEGSLFQFANRCNTLGGRQKFSQCLAVPLSSEAEIVSQQEAIQELTPLLDFRQRVQAGGMEIKELPSDRLQLTQWAKQPAFLYGKKIYKVLLFVIPLVTLGFV